MLKTLVSALCFSALAATVSADMHAASPLEQRDAARAVAARRAIARRAAHASPGEYSGAGLASALADTVQSVQAGQIACTTTDDCANAPTIAGSQALCISGGCRLRCKTGKRPLGGTPPSQCVDDDSSCTSVTDSSRTVQCPVVINGWTTCNAHGTKCNKKCLKAWRLRDNNDGTFTCVDIYHDAANCGGSGKACPPDYNGLAGSAPRCRSKGCTLYCPAGTTPTPTGNAERPMACA